MTPIEEKRLLDYFPEAGMKNVDWNRNKMFLTDRDYRRELKSLNPDFSSVANTLPGAMSFVGQAFNSFNYDKTASDMLRDAGTTYGTVNGVNYLKYNNIDNAAIHSEEHKSNVNNTLGLMGTGATIGATLGPLGLIGGGLVGGAIGLFGGGRKHAEMRRLQEEAANKAMVFDRLGFSGAATKGLRADNAIKYGDYLNAPLYGHAQYGLDMINNNNIVLGTAGETEWTPGDSKRTGVIPGSKSAGDNIPVNAGPTSVIFPEAYNFNLASMPYIAAIKDADAKEKMIDARILSVKGLSAKKVTEHVLSPVRNEIRNTKQLAENNLADLADTMHNMRENKLLPDPNGQTKHAAFGLDWGNNLTGVLGVMAGIGLYFGARNQKIKNPNTYFPNTLASRALDRLDSLRINPYPIMRLLDNDAAGARYRIATAGGLSGAQKYLGNIANYTNLYNSRAQSLANILQLNLGLAANAAQARLQHGAQDASNRIQTGQWDLDYYSKAHAARQQGMQTGLYNSLNTLQQWIANANKLRMYEGMRSIYEQDVKNRG